MCSSYLNNYSSSKTVLVVEDDEISFLVLSEYLKQDNYTVERAVNGKEAVFLVKNSEYAFSLVLMDIKMPVMNGFEAAQKIKKINKEIPIIAQTAVVFDWNNKTDFSNFEHVMLKPLDFQKLRKQIDSIISKNKITRLIKFQKN